MLQRGGGHFRRRKPHFFKILLGDFSKQLRIPPAFFKHVSRETCEIAVLEGPGGGSWHVKLDNGNPGSTYLRDGWDSFVKDNSLEESNFLLFRYEGGMRFRVFIYDASACERQLPVAVSSERLTNPESLRKCSRIENIASAANKDFLQKSCNSSKKQRVVRFSAVQGQLKPSKKLHGKVNLDEQDEVGQDKLEEDIRMCHSLSLKEAKLWEIFYSFSSKFPFFRKLMRQSSTGRAGNFLSVPTLFTRDHFPKHSFQLRLQDPNGTAWEVFYDCTFGCRFSKGWGAFSRGNKLCKGDGCIFELVSKFVLQVHIYRLAD